MTQQKDLDTTQFISLPPGTLLSEEPEPLPPSALRRPLLLAVALGLLAGAFLLLVIISFTRVRH